jgi:subtilisin-like proprotein convertase family protein
MNISSAIHSLFLSALFLVVVLVSQSTANAQAEWIRRLDGNGNGYIEPDEISDRARPYFERFAEEAGIRLTRPNSIGRLEDAARRYFDRRREESSDEVQPKLPSNIKGFGSAEDTLGVPGFGFGKLKYPYSLEDVEEAESTFRRYDRDEDGFLDAREVGRAQWTKTDPFADDLNRDGKLSKMELIQRYAGRRIVELRKQQAIVSSGSNSGTATQEETEEQRRERERNWWRSRYMDRGSRELASGVVERFDFNKNNVLDPAEIIAAGFETGKADLNRDGNVDREELTSWFSNEMDAIGDRMSDALPIWFFERDANNDSQIQMAEFTDQWDAEKAQEFASYDANNDGILTTDELLNSRSIVGGQFASDKAKLLLPRDSVISEIEVEEDYVIGSLKVQLSITHTYTEHLDGYLLGPDGKQIELFTGVGGSDDHFDRTIFSDSAGENIARSRPPFRGEFQPEAILKKQPGLGHFTGQNLKGVWQLIIRSSRSERSGVLHGWSLIVQPAVKSEYPVE